MLYGKNGREDLVVRGARVLDPVEGLDSVCDVRVDGGTISAIDRWDFRWSCFLRRTRTC